jgi:hydrogenase 3 maturation protease
MSDLRQQLRGVLRGCVCFVGVGNPEHSDDGFGVYLAEELRAALAPGLPEGVPDRAPPRSPASPVEVRPDRSVLPVRARVQVRLAGISPEDHLASLAEGRFDQVMFLDAVDFGGQPGAVVLLDSNAMAARFPQVSTHRLSLGLLAQGLEQSRRLRVWLLGVQPASVREGRGLSPVVVATLTLLKSLLLEATEEVPAC